MHQIDFQPCFLLFSGSSTTFRWRNTPARPSPKESRAQRKFTSPSTRKFTECSTCTTTATTILRYGDLRCAFHSNQHISIFLYIFSVLYHIIILSSYIFINRSDLYHYHLKKRTTLKFWWSFDMRSMIAVVILNRFTCMSSRLHIYTGAQMMAATAHTFDLNISHETPIFSLSK